MSQKKRLTKKQSAVIDELVSGELDEQQILDKYNVSRGVYNNWQADEQFVAELDRRIDWLGRQSAVLIARYASVAAAKLIGRRLLQGAQQRRRLAGQSGNHQLSHLAGGQDFCGFRVDDLRVEVVIANMNPALVPALVSHTRPYYLGEPVDIQSE